MNENLYHVANIVLCRAVLQDGLFLSPEKVGTWDAKGVDIYATLGDFDGMFVYPLEPLAGETNFLKQINRENRALASQMRGSMFFSPRYIVHRYADQEDRNKINRFWAVKDHNFFFAANVYLRDHKESDKKAIVSKLEEMLHENAKGQFQYVTYRPMEVSDIMILFKCRSLRPVMDTLHVLYRRFGSKVIPLENDVKFRIGFSSTVCALPWEKLKPENLEASCTDIQAFAPDERIGSIHVRAVLKNIERAEQVEEDVFGRLFAPKRLFSCRRSRTSVSRVFVLGNFDYSASQIDTKTTDVYRFISHILQKINKQQIGGVVASLNTQIGIPFGTDITPAPTMKLVEEPTLLHKTCKTLYEKFRVMLDDERNKNVFSQQSWVMQTLKQVNLLAVMSESCIFDRTCYLVLDSVFFFYTWLEKLLATLKDSREIVHCLVRHSRQINHFLNGWSRLMEHIVRVDAAHTITANYDPPADEMCALILECCLFFCKNVAFVLDDGEPSEELHPYAHIISPALCRRIKSTEQLGLSQETECLRFLEIPIESLGEDAAMVCRSAAHEEAHTYGDDTRLRDPRRELYLKAFCTAALNWLKHDTKNSIITLYNYMNAKLEMFEKCESKHYLADIVGQTKAIASDLIAEDQLDELLRAEQQVDKDAYHEKLRIVRRNQILDIISQDLGELFKECYADVAMIQILGWDAREYFRLFSMEFSRLNCAPSTQYIKARSLVQRFFLVGKTMEVDLSVLDFFSYDPIATNLYGELVDLFQKELPLLAAGYDLFDRGQADSASLGEDYYPYATLDFIVDYLKACLEMLRDEVQSDKKAAHLANIHKLYKRIATCDFLHDDVFQMLTEHHQEIEQTIASKMQLSI